jgi:putative transposase
MGEGSMKKTKFSHERIVCILRQAEAATPAIAVCWQNGISEQAFYRWKKRFASMGVGEVRRLRYLEEENNKLK